MLAERIVALATSATAALSQRARDLRLAGREVIDLAEGEPDFDTPPHVVEAAYAAMKKGETRYTAVRGTETLVAAVQRKFATENGLDYRSDQIIVGTGAKQLIFNALLATLEAGDEVVVPAPYWVTYPAIVSLCGGVPVVVPCPPSAGFKLTPDALEAALTERTKWLILNSPNNPSGAVYGKADLAAIGEVLGRHPGVHVLSDDIYEHLIYDDQAFATLAAAAPDLQDRTLTVNGVSKAYAMTGWRLGYAGGPEWLISALVKLQSQSTTHASSVSQAAAVAALEGPQDFVASARAAYQRRRQVAAAGLQAIAGLSCRPPEGAFYLFVECIPLLDASIADDARFAGELLDHAGVAVVPGSAFGMPGYFRLCFAKEEATLAEAIERMTRACGRLVGA